MSTSDLALQTALFTALRLSRSLQSKGSLSPALTAIEQVAHSIPAACVTSAWKVAKQIATLCNRISAKCTSEQAMTYLHRADAVLTSYAERLTGEEMGASESVFRLRNLTWNNIAMWHKQRGSHHMAVYYLIKAVKLVQGTHILKDPDSLHAAAQTRVNIAAIYTEIGRFKEAVEHAEEALVVLQKEMKLRQQSSTTSKRPKKKFETMIVLFTIAFYTIGIGEEALYHRSEALEAYQHAVSIGQHHLKSSNRALSLAKAALSDLNSAIEGTLLPSRPLPRPDLDRIQIVSLTPSPSGSRKQTSPIEVPMKQKVLRKVASVEDMGKTVSHGNSQRSITQKSVNIMKGRSSSSLASAKPDTHFPDDDKYYTREDLAKLKRNREESQKLGFVSSDQYFLMKITKQLNVTNDIHHFRPFSASNAMCAWEKDGEEKRLVSALRLKRHPQSSHRSSAHGLEVALKLINRLKEEDVLISKRNSVKIQSRLQAKSHQKAVQNAINLRNSDMRNASHPPQRLYFRVHTEGSPDRSALGQFPVAEFQAEKNSPKAVMPPAKEEIEKMMDELNSELKILNEPQGKQDIRKHEHVRRSCDLAASTIHHGVAKHTTTRKSEEPAPREKVELLASIVERKKTALLNAQRAVTFKRPVLFPY